jgi:hypothetical protein
MVTYGSRHNRVYRSRGKATLHTCVSCGKSAENWAHIHGTLGDDPKNYQPMCVICHARYDLVNRRKPDQDYYMVRHALGRGGTQTGYKSDRCRCDDCREWKKEAHLRQRSRWPVPEIQLVFSSGRQYLITTSRQTNRRERAVNPSIGDAMERVSLPVTHGPGRGGTQTGFRKDKCRCDDCRAWKSADNLRYRGKSPEELPDSRVSIPTVSPVPVTVNSFVMSSPVSAQELAMHDMTGILSALGSDPEWRRFIEDAVPGESSALRILIDNHNRSGNFPRIQYGLHEGIFWAGAADYAALEMTVTSRTERVTAAQRPAVVVHTEQADVQLPQRAPLARHRDVRPGRLPTVPGVPLRTANPASQRGSVTAVPDRAVWG